MPNSSLPKALPEWEAVLSSAAHLQRILPDAVLVGGTASAMHAAHRRSIAADHTVDDLRGRFDAILAQYKGLVPRWQDWNNVRATCGAVAVRLFQKVDRTFCAADYAVDASGSLKRICDHALRMGNRR